MKLGTKLSLMVLSFFISMMLLSSCRSQQTATPRLDSLVQQKFGDNIVRQVSPKNTYVLYKQSADTVVNEKVAQKYAVYRLKDQQLSIEGTYSRGYVKWLGDKKLEILHIPPTAKISEDLSVFKREILLEGPAGDSIQTR